MITNIETNKNMKINGKQNEAHHQSTRLLGLSLIRWWGQSSLFDKCLTNLLQCENFLYGLSCKPFWLLCHWWNSLYLPDKWFVQAIRSWQTSKVWLAIIKPLIESRNTKYSKNTKRKVEKVLTATDSQPSATDLIKHSTPADGSAVDRALVQGETTTIWVTAASGV